MQRRPHWTRGLAASAAIAVLLGALYLVGRHGWMRPMLLTGTGSLRFGIIAGIAVACPLATSVVPLAARLPILLGASIVATLVALNAWALILFAYVALAVALARLAWPVLARAAILLVAWLAVPIIRVRVFSIDHQAATIFLTFLWTSQLYAALFLLVERARDPAPMRSSVASDVFYLLALPRVVLPFFQPISPQRMASSVRAHLPWRLIARGLALGAYGAGLAIVVVRLMRFVHPKQHPILAMAGHYGVFYAEATYTIFLAIAVFRLLGFNLPSGYARPFLSHSFAEFFRKFNYYVRDAVLSLFYYPLLGHLRTRASQRTASVIASYLGILVGSFFLYDLLVPMSLTIAPHDQFKYYLDPVRLLGFVVFWSLIVLPNAGIAPKQRVPRGRVRTVLSIVWFNLLYLVIWYLQFYGRRAHWRPW